MGLVERFQPRTVSKYTWVKAVRAIFPWYLQNDNKFDIEEAYSSVFALQKGYRLRTDIFEIYKQEVGEWKQLIEAVGWSEEELKEVFGSIMNEVTHQLLIPIVRSIPQNRAVISAHGINVIRFNDVAIPLLTNGFDLVNKDPILRTVPKGKYGHMETEEVVNATFVKKIATQR